MTKQNLQENLLKVTKLKINSKGVIYVSKKSQDKFSLNFTGPQKMSGGRALPREWKMRWCWWVASARLQAPHWDLAVTFAFRPTAGSLRVPQLLSGNLLPTGTDGVWAHVYKYMCVQQQRLLLHPADGASIVQSDLVLSVCSGVSRSLCMDHK